MACVGSLTAFILGTVGLTNAVQNKPWGVPDVLREEYDTKIQSLVLASAASSGDDTAMIPRVEAPNTRATINGTVSGEKVEHTFQIANAGRDTLSLRVDMEPFEDQDEPDFEWTLNDTKVAPMSQTSLTITWQAGHSEANQRRHLTVKTNDPLRPKIRFSIFASVSRPLLTPSIIAVGSVSSEETFNARFFVASETTSEVGVLGVASNLSGFQWKTMPVDRTRVPADYASAEHLTQIEIQGSRKEFGNFEERVELDLLVNGEPVKRNAKVAGTVKVPIAFIHREMHKREGLSIGTISSKEDFAVNVAVRHRGEATRKLEVLDHEPKFLDVTIEPGESGYRSSRLIVTIPKGTPTYAFDRDDHHGYIKVGDPADETFSGWFSIYGAVAKEF